MYQQHPASISQEGISFKPSNLQSEHLDCIKLMRLGFLSLRTSSSHIGWDTMMLQIQGWPTQHWAERSAFFWRSKRCTRWTSAGNDRWRGVGEYAHHFPKFFMWCIMAHYGALWRIPNCLFSIFSGTNASHCLDQDNFARLLLLKVDTAMESSTVPRSRRFFKNWQVWRIGLNVILSYPGLEHTWTYLNYK